MEAYGDVKESSKLTHRCPNLQIAKEWGSLGIRCNAVTYGFIATRLTAVSIAKHLPYISASYMTA